MKHAKIWRRLIIALAAIGLVAAMVASTRFVRGEVTTTPTGSSAALDPKEWAQANYASAVVPAIEDKAQPWATLITALLADPDGACSQYGQQEPGANSCSFATTVTGVLAAGNFGELAIAADTPGGITVGFQVGPAITGTSLRDACGLANFGMFLNQTAYQQAGTELNNMMKQAVLASFDAKAAIGKTYTVIGAFDWDGSGHVTITPVSIEVAS